MMRFGAATVFAGVFSALFGLATPTFAQEADDEAPVAAKLGSERITAEILGLEPAGEPVVSSITAKGDAIFSAAFRLREEGRLAADIATESYRMTAGAPVVHREFKQRGADQSEAVQAWCGPGENRTMFGWSGGGTVCMVHTADGKANLGAPQLNFGPWWMATNVSFVNLSARTERVAIEPASTPSVFNMVFVYERLRTEGVALHAAIEGPGMGADARPWRYEMARRILPVIEGAAQLEYDGLKLSLTPQRRGDVVAAVSERVAPPIDLEVLRVQAQADEAAIDPVSGPGVAEGTMADAETPTVESEGVEPTAFVIGGLRLDPVALTVGQGVLTRGGVAVSGNATYAVTATLAKPLNLRAPFINDIAPEGLILHQVEFARISPLGSRTMTRIWCGPIGRPTVWSSDRVTMCLRRAPFSGLEAFWPSTGRPWLGTTQATGLAATLEARDFEVKTSEIPLLEPLGVRAEIQRITDKAVTLRVFARRGDEDALILTVSPNFDDGVAVLPLWTHRLILTRSGTGVTVALPADGDGKAPSDEGFYP